MNGSVGNVTPSSGVVYLVGAGPGDPDLITVRGRDLLARADVVVYDRLVDDRLLGFTRPDARLLYVGKTAGNHYVPQREINNLLIEHARHGRVVVRLKGGDPFVFGRGGEEAAAVAAAGVRFEVVPGVTSAIAVPAYAGIPVTHRDHASAVTIVTGHEDPLKESSAIDWDALGRSGATLVVLMGVANLPTIVDRLLASGRSAETPVAIIRNGSCPDQETVTGSLCDIVDRVRAARIVSPAVIVVGTVVRLREQLDWFGMFAPSSPVTDAPTARLDSLPLLCL